MSIETQETIPEMARFIRKNIGFMLSDDIGRLQSGLNPVAKSEAAGLGMWIGGAILEGYSSCALREEVHEALGHVLPLLKVEPEIAGVVYEEAMRTAGLEEGVAA